jgi:hypothetical protein
MPRHFPSRAGVPPAPVARKEEAARRPKRGPQERGIGSSHYRANTYNIDAVEVFFSSGAPCMTNGD